MTKLFIDFYFELRNSGGLKNEVTMQMNAQSIKELEEWLKTKKKYRALLKKWAWPLQNKLGFKKKYSDFQQARPDWLQAYMSLSNQMIESYKADGRLNQSAFSEGKCTLKPKGSPIHEIEFAGHALIKAKCPSHYAPNKELSSVEEMLHCWSIWFDSEHLLDAQRGLAQAEARRILVALDHAEISQATQVASTSVRPASAGRL